MLILIVGYNWFEVIIEFENRFTKGIEKTIVASNFSSNC
jgi:hypothetical protein